MLRAIREWFVESRSRAASDLPVLKWWKSKPNWGDRLNPVLFQRISGSPSRHVDLKNPRRLSNFMVLGSILAWADEASIVWGPGFLWPDQRLRAKPRQICAVRGPLSRSLLHDQGLSCPEIYGDPALLFPRFYAPSVSKTYALGVVPHYVDRKHPWVRRLRSRRTSWSSTWEMSLTGTLIRS